MSGEIPGLLGMAFHAVMEEVHVRLAEEGFDDVRPAHGFAFQYLSVRGGATAEDRWAALVGSERLTTLREDLSAFVIAAGSPPIRPLW